MLAQVEPGQQNVEHEFRDVDGMSKHELMVYARSVLNVDVRELAADGKRTRFRPVGAVQQDCRTEVARRMQSVCRGVHSERGADASGGGPAQLGQESVEEEEIELMAAFKRLVRRNVCAMGGKEVIGFARVLGVPVTHRKNRQYRSISDLRKECIAVKTKIIYLGDLCNEDVERMKGTHLVHYAQRVLGLRIRHQDVRTRHHGFDCDLRRVCKDEQEKNVKRGVAVNCAWVLGEGLKIVSIVTLKRQRDIAEVVGRVFPGLASTSSLLCAKLC